MHLAQLAGQLRRRHAIADPPAGGMQRLAEGKHREAALAQFRVRQHRCMAAAVEEHVLVHLVGEHGDRPVADQAASASRSSRVATVQLGFCGLLMMMSRVRSLKARRTWSQSKRKAGRRERNAHASAAGEPHRGLVGIVGGIENDGLIARAHHRLDGVVQRLGAAAGDRDLGLRIEAAP